MSTTVDAAPDDIWRLMLDKVVTPALNIPELQDLRILQRHSESLVREYYLNGLRVVENVVMDPGARKITFTLIGHIQFEGYTSQQILRSETSAATGCVVSITVDWRPKNDDKLENVPDLLQTVNDDLFHIKDLVEQAVLATAAAEQNRTDAGSGTAPADNDSTLTDSEPTPADIDTAPTPADVDATLTDIKPVQAGNEAALTDSEPADADGIAAAG